MNPPTPRALGYRMPAEWEPQEAVWLAWPTNPETWFDAIAETVRQTYVETIRGLSATQTVCLLVDDAASEAGARDQLLRNGVRTDSVRFFRVPTVDTWIRDYGPTFLVRTGSAPVAMVKWTFNAWGNKYEELQADDCVPFAMNSHLGFPVFEAGAVLEGGSIEVNGRGSVLTTEQCLLNPNRNPDMDRKAIEELLAEFLGVSNVLWLGDGIVGDDTDGHVDDIARFVDARTIVAAWEDDPGDDNYPILRDNHERLGRMRDPRGREFRVVPLPMPDPVSGPDGRLPASYANFFVGNGTVIVPVFGQKKDSRALEVIQSCFPRHRVVGVDCRAMVHGLGAIHCCSQQQPRPNSR